MFVSRNHNVGQDHNRSKLWKSSNTCERQNKPTVHSQRKRRLNTGNACFHSVQNPSDFLSAKKNYITIYNTKCKSCFKNLKLFYIITKRGLSS